MSSGAASRRKGRTGEAELRSIFHTAGATVHAGQRNLVGECDLLVTIRGSSERLHVECKRQERLRLPEWLAQAAKDASPDAAPVVVFRQSHGRWYAALALDDLLRLCG